MPRKLNGFWRLTLAFLASLALVALMTQPALAHAVTPGDKGYIQEIYGIHILPFLYLGAKHMVTGL
ncbi:MAG: HupE/UreJ family protein, partial [Bauldia litoralis]